MEIVKFPLNAGKAMGNYFIANKKGLRDLPQALDIILVAGPGFEPGTFGL
ncbi:MAG: hypothetical protein V1753_02865 [Pseudomonadota bacterium]